MWNMRAALCDYYKRPEAWPYSIGTIQDKPSGRCGHITIIEVISLSVLLVSANYL
jgi:hypothetical protein